VWVESRSLAPQNVCLGVSRTCWWPRVPEGVVEFLHFGVGGDVLARVVFPMDGGPFEV